MRLVEILALINVYSPWLYAAGLLGLLYGLYELRAAQKNLGETIFTLEKEFAAKRATRARAILITVIVLLAALTLLRFGVAPLQSLPSVERPTPTRLVLEPPTAVPVTPTPTSTAIPTRPRPTAAPPTETPAPTAVPPPPCPRPDVCISSPAPNQVVSGQVTIRGTANIEAFQFYKVEYGQGESPLQWNSIGEVRRERVVDGILTTWNTAGFPQGPYILRLTVVDASGNFPAPFTVRVVIQ